MLESVVKLKESMKTSDYHTASLVVPHVVVMNAFNCRSCSSIMDASISKVNEDLKISIFFLPIIRLTGQGHLSDFKECGVSLYEFVISIELVFTRKTATLRVLGSSEGLLSGCRDGCFRGLG